MVKIRKKTSRVTLLASKTNCNRVKSGTHSLVKVLQLEGYEIRDGYVMSKGTPIPLMAIDFKPRQKRELVRQKKEE